MASTGSHSMVFQSSMVAVTPGFRRGLGYGASEGERYGLVAIEIREGCRKVALKARVCRVAVGVGQRGGQCLCVSGDTQKPHGGLPLAGIAAFSELGEMQGDIGGRSVGSGGEVQRACRSAQAAFYALYPVRRIARRLDDESELPHLLVHRSGQFIVGVGLDGHFLHGSEEPAGSMADICPVACFRGYRSGGAADGDVLGGVVSRKGVVAGIEEVIRRMGLSGLRAGIVAHRHCPLRRDVHAVAPVSPVGGDGDCPVRRVRRVVKLVLDTGGKQRQGCGQYNNVEFVRFHYKDILMDLSEYRNYKFHARVTPADIGPHQFLHSEPWRTRTPSTTVYFS